MATELFSRLYHQAFRLDCPLIPIINKLKHGLESSGKTLERVEMAKNLYNAGADFIDALDEIAGKQFRICNPRSRAYRNSVREYRCPNCGSPYCDNAVEMIRIPEGLHISIISPANSVEFTEDNELPYEDEE